MYSYETPQKTPLIVWIKEAIGAFCALIGMPVLVVLIAVALGAGA